MLPSGTRSTVDMTEMLHNLLTHDTVCILCLECFSVLFRTWVSVAPQPLVAEISITTRNTSKNEPEKLFFHLRLRASVIMSYINKKSFSGERSMLNLWIFTLPFIYLLIL